MSNKSDSLNIIEKYNNINKLYEDRNDYYSIGVLGCVKKRELKDNLDWQFLIIDCFANPPVRKHENLFLSLSYNIRYDSLNNSEYDFYKKCKASLGSIIESYEESELRMKFENNDVIDKKKLMGDVFNNKMKIKDFYKTFPGFVDLPPLSLAELHQLNTHINLKLEETKFKGLKQIIKISKDIVTPLYDELKIYFEEFDYISLENALKGYSLNEPILYKGDQNQLTEVFLRLKYNDLLEGSNKKIIKWLCNNFTFKDKKDGNIKPFNKSTVESSFKAKGEVSRDNSILNDLNWLKYLPRDKREV